MTILFCDCFSGVSGDMFLAAFVDAGLPLEYLQEHLSALHLPEFQSVSSHVVHKGALVATQIDFAILGQDKPVHGHSSAEEMHHHNHDHPHEHDHMHISDHPHAENQEENPHFHAHKRNLSEISTLIQSSDLAVGIKTTGLKVFNLLAEAEARVHGTTIEEVHFHEVGAADSILDIVGMAIALDYFNITSVYSSPLPLGSGHVMTQHGRLPIPAPATLELIRIANAPVIPSNATVELVTPTGAAILAALATFCQPSMCLEKAGTGAGKHNLEWPNVMRIMMGNPIQSSQTHIEIETNIDDMNPQLFSYVMEKLFQAGALDVYFTPIYMKKNRPATKLSVIARVEDEQVLSQIIVRDTSTLGVRITPVYRIEAQREIKQVDTDYGLIPVKMKIIHGDVVQFTPEFDACVRLADQFNLPVAVILQAAILKSHE
jgi:pyridinium-3,5-bisthiocarboxylic acid mononucleotide nickel chelatase